MFLEKPNLIRVKILTSALHIHLSACLKNMRILKITSPHIKIYIKDDKQSIQIRHHFSHQQIRQFPFLCPHLLFFPLHFPILHSIFPSPTFIPFWPKLLSLQASKATTTALSLTESSFKVFDFFVASVISRGNRDFCSPSTPSICTPVQFLSGNRACLQWELQEN